MSNIQQNAYTLTPVRVSRKSLNLMKNSQSLNRSPQLLDCEVNNEDCAKESADFKKEREKAHHHVSHNCIC